MLQRMWINQPSTQQPHHQLHGTQVLADLNDPTPANAVARVYFTDGNVISQHVLRDALSPGWPRR